MQNLFITNWFQITYFRISCCSEINRLVLMMNCSLLNAMGTSKWWSLFKMHDPNNYNNMRLMGTRMPSVSHRYALSRAYLYNSVNAHWWVTDGIPIDQWFTNCAVAPHTQARDLSHQLPEAYWVFQL